MRRERGQKSRNLTTPLKEVGKYKPNTHWKHKMKCIQIENVMKTINTMRHQTIYKWKGAAAVAGLGTPGAGGARHCRRTLSFVYGLMSHCIDRFHYVFHLYTFHFMLPMCILGQKQIGKVIWLAEPGEIGSNLKRLLQKGCSWNLEEPTEAGTTALSLKLSKNPYS